MRKPLGALGRTVGLFPHAATLLLLLSAALLLFSPTICHAQDEIGICVTPNYTTVVLTDWKANFSVNMPEIAVPGQSYNVSIQGEYPIYPGNWDYVLSPSVPSCPDVIISAWKSGVVNGLLMLTQPAPYISLSNLTYVSPTLTTFTFSISMDAPPGVSYLQLTNDTSFLPNGNIAKVNSNNWGQFPVIIACPTPKITSPGLLPKTWFAGKSYNITITGTGFNTTAAPGCPVTPVAVKAGTGSSVTLSNVTVVSPTQITATVTPAASDPTGVAAITVGSSSTGMFSVRTQILGNQIQWNGKTISTTDGSTPPTQNAIVGQQIALTTPALPAGNTTTSTTWTVGGTNIGGYTPTSTGASVTPTTLTNPSLTTYLVNTGTNIPVTYQYSVNIEGLSATDIENGLNSSLPANAVFTITGPTGVTVTPSGQTFFIPADQLEMIWGIKFDATATSPNSNAGVYTWVQIVQSLTETVNLNDGTQTTCTGGPGLDTVYPYTTGLYAEDGPLNPLDSTLQTGEIYAATYQLYLMWNPQTSGSIPIPLGSVEWNTLGSVTWNSATSTWIVNSGVTTSGTFTTQSPSYPQWSTTVTPQTIAASCN